MREGILKSISVEEIPNFQVVRKNPGGIFE